MARHQIRLESLLSKIVVDADGVRVGRIEELHGEQSASDFEIREILLGPHALLERVTTWIPKMGIFFGKFGSTYRIPWNKIDLSDPDHPRLTVQKKSLKPEEN